MLELARTKARPDTSRSEHAGWGIVDVILAVLMLPFGLAMFLIERLVWVVTAGFKD